MTDACSNLQPTSIILHQEEEMLKYKKCSDTVIVELEGVPRYMGTRVSYMRLAGRSPLCWTLKGLPRPENSLYMAQDTN